VLCGERIKMRGDQLARQWRIIRAIEASPTGLTVAEIAKREETGIRTIYRDLEALHGNGDGNGDVVENKHFTYDRFFDRR
jgi:hypothetical protein